MEKETRKKKTMKGERKEWKKKKTKEQKKTNKRRKEENKRWRERKNIKMRIGTKIYYKEKCAHMGTDRNAPKKRK